MKNLLDYNKIEIGDALVTFQEKDLAPIPTGFSKKFIENLYDKSSSIDEFIGKLNKLNALKNKPTNNPIIICGYKIYLS